MILLIYGTRPEWLKIKPLVEVFEQNNVRYEVCFTGQQKDIAGGEYDFSLDIKSKCENRLNDIISSCLEQMSDRTYSLVIVQGDTTSALAMALWAFNSNIKVAHLEAGLRTYDVANPWPEEMNRQIISRIASLHFCPTIQNKENLLSEKMNSGTHVFVTGNTALDNLKDIEASKEGIVLITMHRRENLNSIDVWFETINKLAQAHNDFKFIFPMHPNPALQEKKHILSHVNVIKPLEHEEMCKLIAGSDMVLTDSGGIQEECSFFNKKCIVLRKTTERQESLGITSFLCPNTSDLRTLFVLHLKRDAETVPCPYGDGKAAFKIYEILKQKNFIEHNY